jgi:hypothetical protein
MDKKPDKPRYSEEVILMKSRLTAKNARSVLPALTAFNVTEAKINDFEAKIDEAEALPREATNRIEITASTDEKDDALDACVDWGKDLRLRLEFGFGKNSVQYRSFPSSDFEQARTSEIVMKKVMTTLIEIAKKYPVELAEEGQTPEILAQGDELLNELRETDLTQETQKAGKPLLTQDRYQKFLHLYKTTNKINRVGRSVFKSDPLKRAMFASRWPKAAASPKAEEKPEE